MRRISVILIFITLICTVFSLYTNDNIWTDNSTEINIYNEIEKEKENNLFLNVSKREPKSKVKYAKKVKKVKVKAKGKGKGKFDIKVSVIIPTYNSEKLIGRCLESALNQTLKEIEIIVVDDGSTDSTRSIIEEYRKKDDRIKYIFKGNNSGVAISRNIALEEMRGEFVGFIDADDYVDPEWFESLYENSKDMDLVRGIRVIHNFSDNYVKLPRKPYGCIIPSIIRKSFLDEHRIRFPRIKKLEDSKFNQKIKSKKPRTFCLPDNGVYYHYVKREGSLSNYINPNNNDIGIGIGIGIGIEIESESESEISELISNADIITNISEERNRTNERNSKILFFSKEIIHGTVLICFILIAIYYFGRKRRNSNKKNGFYERSEEEVEEILIPDQDEIT